VTRRAPGAPDAVIFDLDGLLIDSEPLWAASEREVFGAVGVELSDTDLATTIGMRVDEVAQHWYRRRPWSGPSPADVAAQLIDAVVAAVTATGTAMPGAEHAIAVSADLGVPLAIASSSPRRIIEAALARLGVAAAFGAVVSAEHLPKGKPDPAVYLAAADALGVAPARSTALEDSPAGTGSAKNAGMWCVAVPAPGHEAAVGDLADVVLASLADLTSEHLAPAGLAPERRDP
jgi:sugar-phosphatase